MSSEGTLTSTYQNYPSIFEVVAAGNLDQSLHAALSKILEFVEISKYGRILKHHEEICFLLHAALQSCCISKRGASFGELFYGIEKCGTSEKFTALKKTLIIASIILPPYFRSQLKKTPADQSSRFQRLASLLSLNKLTKPVMKLLYLLRIFNSQCLAMQALQLGVRYSNPSIVESTFNVIFFKSLEVLTFALSFIQWSYNSYSLKAIPNLPNPDIEKQIKLTCSGKWKNICPVCLQKPTTPTAASLSGYVFCYKCIHNYWKLHKSCPVTDYPLSFNDLIVIYDE